MVCQEGRHYWAVTAEYTIDGEKDARRSEMGRRKIDYKEEMTPENFAVFARLRDWRKETAQKEAVQLYTIFMNEQLAAMVEKRVTTKKGLLEIDGVGQGKAEKYGEAVLAILNEELSRQTERQDEANQESVSPIGGAGKPAGSLS